MRSIATTATSPRDLRLAVGLLLLCASAVGAEPRGTIQSVAGDTVTVTLAPGERPQVGDRARVSWSFGGEIVPVGTGAVASVSRGEARVRLEPTESIVQPGMDVAFESRSAAERGGSEGEEKGKAPPPRSTARDIAKKRLQEYGGEKGRSYYTGTAFVIEAGLDTWWARSLVTQWIDGDFEASAGLRIQTAHTPRSVVGLVFDASDPSDPDLARGAIFFGKDEKRLILTRYGGPGEAWTPLVETPADVPISQADTFEIARTGGEFRFRLNGREVARWEASRVERGLLKFYVWECHGQLRDWRIEAPVDSP